MTAKSGRGRQARLAAALKENLKRRKEGERAKSAKDEKALGPAALGTAPEAGLENESSSRPKAAPKTI